MSIATEPRYQYMPSMSDEDYEALKRSIGEHGFWMEFAVVVDEDGRILDGHHRAKACAELGVECPSRERAGMTESEKDEYIWAVNIGRRHLTLEQKRELIRHRLVTRPQESDRSIARDVGVHNETVHRIREELEETDGIRQFRAEGGRGVSEGRAVSPDDYARCDICEKPARRENLREINGLSGHATCLPVADGVNGDAPAARPPLRLPTDEEFFRDQTAKLKRLLAQIVKAHDTGNTKAMARLIERARTEAS